MIFAVITIGCTGRVGDDVGLADGGVDQQPVDDQPRTIECSLAAPCTAPQICVASQCRDRGPDADGDGACADFDNDDNDPAVSPFIERPDNNIDDNGDGRIDEAPTVHGHCRLPLWSHAVLRWHVPLQLAVRRLPPRC